LKEVQALVKALPAYNKALAKTDMQYYTDLNVAEQKAIDDAVELSLAFDMAWKGAVVSPNR
jgi:hypothetical protein